MATGLTLAAGALAVPVASAAGLPDGRAHELVSPAGKNGAEIMPNATKTRASAAGDAIEFASLGAFGDVVGTGVATEYVAQRTGAAGTSGWGTHSVTPPQNGLSLGAIVGRSEPHYMGAPAADLSAAAFRAWTPLSDNPEIEGVVNLYVRKDLRSQGAGEYSLVTACPLCVSAGSTLLDLALIPDLARLAGPTFAGASSDFSHVFFESRQTLTADAPLDPLLQAPKLYEWVGGAVRVVGVLPDGRTAPRSIAGRGASSTAGPLSTTHPISADGDRVVFTVATRNTGVDGAIYMRVNARTSFQLNASEQVAPATQPAQYWDASSDGSRVFFTTQDTLTDDPAVVPGNKLYMWKQGDTDEVQSVAVSATGGTYRLRYGGQSTDPIAAVAGPDIVEAALEQVPAIGGGNVRVTGGPGDATASAPYLVTFQGDLAGVNALELTGDGSGLTGGGAAVTIATDQPVTNLTLLNVDSQSEEAPNSFRGVFGASDDGTNLYFVAFGQLVDGGPRLGSSAAIYRWHEGSLSFVGAIPRSGFDTLEYFDDARLAGTQRQTRVTPDGRHLLFTVSTGTGVLSSKGGIDYDHGSCRGVTGGCREVYVYSADTDELACASCNPSGATATTNAVTRIRTGSGGAQFTSYMSRPISDDGRFVFFSTAEALVPEDVNNRSDAYEYDVAAGVPHLLSSGTDPSSSYFLDASSSGDDAFFVTREQLVGWDVDGSYDLYDARVGGGFAEPAAPAPGCAGDACQGAPSDAPHPKQAGSGLVAGAGNASDKLAPRSSGRRTSRHRRKQCRRGKMRKRVHGKVRCVKRKHVHRKVKRSRAHRRRTAERIASTRRAR